MPKGIKGFQKGHPGYNWGHPMPLEAREAISNKLKEGYRSGNIKHPRLGIKRPIMINAGDTAIHLWVKRWFGNPIKCDECGKPNKKAKDGRSWLQWANKNHQYKRIRKDWMVLCPPCHKKYDLKNN